MGGDEVWAAGGGTSGGEEEEETSHSWPGSRSGSVHTKQEAGGRLCRASGGWEGEAGLGRGRGVGRASTCPSPTHTEERGRGAQPSSGCPAAHLVPARPRLLGAGPGGSWTSESAPWRRRRLVGKDVARAAGGTCWWQVCSDQPGCCGRAAQGGGTPPQGGEPLASQARPRTMTACAAAPPAPACPVAASGGQRPVKSGEVGPGEWRPETDSAPLPRPVLELTL